MNKVIVLFLLDPTKDYKPMYEYNSAEEFFTAVETGEGVPKMNDIIAEAWVSDNIVDMGNTFKVTLEKLKLILDY